MYMYTVFPIVTGHTVYTNHTHPMQGPGTMGGALRCLEVHWAIIVIRCTVYLEPASELRRGICTLVLFITQMSTCVQGCLGLLCDFSTCTLFCRSKLAPPLTNSTTTSVSPHLAALMSADFPACAVTDNVWVQTFVII